MTDPAPDEDVTAALSDAQLEELLALLYAPELIAPFGDLDFDWDDVIHESGQSVVVRAWNAAARRTEIVKMMQPGFPEALIEREFALAGSAGGHEGIATVYDRAYVGPDRIPVLRIADVGDRTMGDLVSGTTTLAAGAAARYGRLLAEALVFAHGKGVTHQDLKPTNIGYCVRRDAPVIFDFGLGGCADVPDVGGRGTRGFRAPEQLGGGGDDPAQLDHGSAARTDVFGLGATLFWLVEGRVPYRDDDFTVAPTFARLPVPALQDILREFLAPDPTQRPQTMVAAKADLVRFLSSDPGAPLEPPALVDRHHAEIASGREIKPGVLVKMRVRADPSPLHAFFLDINNDTFFDLLSPSGAVIATGPTTSDWTKEQASFLSPGAKLDRTAGVDREVLVGVVSRAPLSELEDAIRGYESVEDLGEIKARRSAIATVADRAAAERERIEALLVSLRTRGFDLAWQVWELRCS